MISQGQVIKRNKIIGMTESQKSSKIKSMTTKTIYILSNPKNKSNKPNFQLKNNSPRGRLKMR